MQLHQNGDQYVINMYSYTKEASDTCTNDKQHTFVLGFGENFLMDHYQLTHFVL